MANPRFPRGAFPPSHMEAHLKIVPKGTAMLQEASFFTERRRSTDGNVAYHFYKRTEY
jgi:hypothetical protein